MSYFKSKLRAIGREYTKRDRIAIIREAGNKCPLCDRVPGDDFLFGPTNYLKQQIKFKVVMDIHVVESSEWGRKLVVMCNGCHLSYHLFNRLSESADMGGKRLEETMYKRCDRCKELTCMCCSKCNKLKKWCTCATKKAKKKVKKISKKRAEKCQTQKIKKVKLRSKKKSTDG